MRFIYTKQFFIFAALLAATALLMLLHNIGALAPVDSAIAESPRPIVYIFSGIGKGVKYVFSYFVSVANLNKTNAELKTEIVSLQEENALLKQYKLENNILKQELDYRGTAPFKLVPADVIAKDPTAYNQSVTIDAGSSSGVALGDAVVAQGVLIGKVSSVDTYTSKVLLVTDPSSKIDAQISDTGDSGILRGDYSSGIILDMISQNAHIARGQEVVSAGLTGDIPKGILIGTIADIKTNKDDLLQQSTVLSSVDLKSLAFVDVMQK